MTESSASPQGAADGEVQDLSELQLKLELTREQRKKAQIRNRMMLLIILWVILAGLFVLLLFFAPDLLATFGFGLALVGVLATYVIS